MEKYLDSVIQDLQNKLKAKDVKLNYQFLGDSVVLKDGKAIKVIPRNEYFKLAKKIKEVYDLQQALNVVK